MSGYFAALGAVGGAVGGYFLGEWLFDHDVAIAIVAVASAFLARDFGMSLGTAFSSILQGFFRRW